MLLRWVLISSIFGGFYFYFYFFYHFHHHAILITHYKMIMCISEWLNNSHVLAEEEQKAKPCSVWFQSPEYYHFYSNLFCLNICHYRFLKSLEPYLHVRSAGTIMPKVTAGSPIPQEPLGSFNFITVTSGTDWGPAVNGLWWQIVNV